MASNNDLRQSLNNLRTQLGEHLDSAAEFNEEQQQHIQNQENPHGVDKAAVGLDQVENYPLASDQDMIDGERSDAYLTPRLANVGWEAHGLQQEKIKPIRTPVPISPIDDQAGLDDQPVLTAGPFARNADLTGTLLRREYQVDVDTGDFSNPVWSGSQGDDSPMTVDTPLDYQQAYQWRVRDVPVDGEAPSDWSEPETFATRNGRILTPTMSIPTDPAGVFEIGVNWGGTEPEGFDTHRATSLVIATDDQFTDVVYEVVETETDKASIPVSSLMDQSTYYAKIQVHGNVIDNGPESEIEMFTTGISEAQMTAYESDGDVYVNDTDADIIGGETVNSPAVPFIGFRDTDGSLLESFRLTEVTTDGTVVAVTKHGNGYAALINDHLTGNAVVVYFNATKTILWTQSLDGVIGQDLTNYGTDIVAVGHRDNGSTNEAVVVMLNNDGTEAWASKLDGVGGQEAYGVYLSGLRLFVVGRQASELGSTDAVEAGFIVEYNPSTGDVVSDTSFGGQAPSRFNAVVVLNDVATAVGVIDGVAAAVQFDVLDELAVLNSRQWTGDMVTLEDISTDDQYLYIAGVGSSGHITGALNANLTERWVVGSNQTNGRPGVIPGFRGLEIQTTYTTGGRVQAALIKLPLNGTVATIPDAVDYQWTTPSLAGAESTGEVIQNIGEWSEWQSIRDDNQTRNTSSTSAPSSSLVDVPPDTMTEKYRSPSWGSRSYLGQQTSTGPWIQYEQFEFVAQGQTSGSFNASAYLPKEPNDTSQYNYFQTEFYLSSTPWSSPFTVNGFGYSTFEDAELQKLLSSSSGGGGPNDVVELVSTGTIFESGGKWYIPRTYRTRSRRYTITRQRQTKTTTTLYRWTAFYEKATRTFVPTNVPVNSLTDLVRTSLTNPTKAVVSLNAYFNNF